jgi:hypothetical protein
VTRPSEVREQKIGPFEYSEALQYIERFALALTNLGLQERYIVDPVPGRTVEWEKRRDGRKGRMQVSYHVVLVDKRPTEPPPENLTALGIGQAVEKGYQPLERHYDALGKRMTLPQWAKAVGTSCAKLRSQINAGATMEEAITQIALKKAN